MLSCAERVQSGPRSLCSLQQAVLEDALAAQALADLPEEGMVRVRVRVRGRVRVRVRVRVRGRGRVREVGVGVGVGVGVALT